MSDSDVEIKRIAPMKPVKKPPNSPTDDLLKAQTKKVTTKTMIHEALNELKTRKGVSIQAIKKYMEEKYYVKTDKVKYQIKKALKKGIEDGTIIQLKGIGASGSFKLAPVKEKTKTKPKPKPKKEKPKKEETAKEKSKEKPLKDKKEKITKEKAKTDKIKPAKKVKLDVKDMEKKEKPKDKKKAELKEKGKAKTAATPAKKKATMMKRKSIGSIIKPPKMKPKSKA